MHYIYKSHVELRVTPRVPSLPPLSFHSFVPSLLWSVGKDTILNYFIYYGFLYLRPIFFRIDKIFINEEINDYISDRLRLGENLEFESSSHKNCGGSYSKDFNGVVSLSESNCSFSGFNLRERERERERGLTCAHA